MGKTLSVGKLMVLKMHVNGQRGCSIDKLRPMTTPSLFNPLNYRQASRKPGHLNGHFGHPIPEEVKPCTFPIIGISLLVLKPPIILLTEFA